MPELEERLGAGVFYGAAASEAPAFAGEKVYVVGGGNAAGQAALHLARFARRVTLLVRGGGLAQSMSVDQLEAAPNVDVRLRTAAVGGGGHGRLEELVLEDRGAGVLETVSAAALFVLIGAEPRTEWLGGSVARDEHGYVLTGHDLREAWLLARAPAMLETALACVPWGVAQAPPLGRTRRRRGSRLALPGSSCRPELGAARTPPLELVLELRQLCVQVVREPEERLVEEPLVLEDRLDVPAQQPPHEAAGSREHARVPRVAVDGDAGVLRGGRARPAPIVRRRQPAARRPP